MIERTIVLPIRDNSGKLHNRTIGQIKRELLDIAGGYSEVRQTGSWRDSDGTIYRDAAWRVVTTVTASEDARINDLLPDWCARLGQLALYTHTTQVEVAFVEPNYAVVQSA